MVPGGNPRLPVDDPVGDRFGGSGLALYLRREARRKHQTRPGWRARNPPQSKINVGHNHPTAIIVAQNAASWAAFLKNLRREARRKRCGRDREITVRNRSEPSSHGSDGRKIGNGRSSTTPSPLHPFQTSKNSCISALCVKNLRRQSIGPCKGSSRFPLEISDMAHDFNSEAQSRRGKVRRDFQKVRMDFDRSLGLKSSDPRRRSCGRPFRGGLALGGVRRRGRRRHIRSARLAGAERLSCRHSAISRRRTYMAPAAEMIRHQRLTSTVSGAYRINFAHNHQIKQVIV